MSENNNGKKKSRFHTARGLVALACVAFVLVGMAFHVGIGTPSAFGIQQISAICPLGALETMAGAKGVMLHPLLLLVLTVALIALVGKAFCAWVCPVPWLQKFFRPKGRKEKAASAEQADSVQPACLERAHASSQPVLSGDSDSGCQKSHLCAQSETADCTNDAKNVATVPHVPPTEPDTSNSGLQPSSETHITGNFGSAAKKPTENAASSTSDCEAAACPTSACAACAGAATCGKALAPVGGKRDGVQLDSRHAVLVGTLASAAVFGFPVFCLICPVGLAFATIIGLWNLVQFNEPTWALIVFPAILILEVTVLRKWCSKICPISALVSLLSNANVTLRPRVKTTTCLRARGVDCHACVDACPEQLDPHSKRIPECSKCGKCVDACPAKAVAIKLLK